ncbi:MAG: hypothetical protein ACLT98_09120 [Eggerthellaceae bacterium]
MAAAVVEHNSLRTVDHIAGGIGNHRRWAAMMAESSALSASSEKFLPSYERASAARREEMREGRLSRRATEQDVVDADSSSFMCGRYQDIELSLIAFHRTSADAAPDRSADIR